MLVYHLIGALLEDGCTLLKKWGLKRVFLQISAVETMFVTRQIPAEHKDLIHDVSYDFHGNRMATCSSDQTVKVQIGPVSFCCYVRFLNR